MLDRPRPTPRRLATAAACLATLALVPSTGRGAEPASTAPIDYNRQVRPILADRCYACHGPDAEVREGGFRLDVREQALAPADSGEAPIVPGRPEASPLIRRINSTRKGVVMPPPSTNKTLSDAEKQVLRDWIAQGAKYQTHWAFEAPRRPPLPAVKDAGWARNPIDRFLLARIEAEGLAPAPEADRATLARRLSLDLTGLPPAPEEVDAFLADRREDAYERLVDRLLASPRFGERMALDWLDAARYADTHGYHIDSGRDMTRWRDWVIDAFNRNLPFDRFTVEQIAGDLLPDATLEQKVASGFNRNHMITFEGGAIPEEYHTAYVVDRVNTTGTVWLGLTVACTQCHDHKYDPLTQREFYQLYAFFNNVPEKGLDGSKGNAAPFIPAPLPAQRAAIDRLKAEEAGLAAELDRPDPSADEAQAAWEREAATAGAPAWEPIAFDDLRSANGVRLQQAGDAIVAAGPNPAVETFTLRARAGRLAGATGLRVELLPLDRLRNNGPGRSVNGNVVLTDVKVAVEAGEEGRREPLSLTGASADFSQDGFPASNAIDGDPRSGWAIFPEVGKPHALVVAFGRAAPEDARAIEVTLAFTSPHESHHPGRFRVALTHAAGPLGTPALPDDVSRALAAGDGRTEAQAAAIRRHFREKVWEPGRRRQERLEQVRRELAELERSVPTAMVMAEMESPRETFLLVRGAYDKKGEKVTPGVPAFLPPLPEGAKPDRLALARWLVDPSHPLVGRVTVNRLWQAIFGTGLVKTAEDFGSQGEPPSHPELLDWLAVEFVSPEAPGDIAWDVKRLIRLIVTSTAYRQSSAATPILIARDPENRLLARGARFRLSAEALRDQALFVAGLLDGEIGGRSVSPYQPPGLWEELMSREDSKNWTAQTYVQGKGKDLYRRTMYTFWKRTSPPPSLATFDAPDREVCTVRRARTNTPLQALVLMNDPTYVEAARALAERATKAGAGGPDDRIARAFRLATGRPIRPAEAAVLRDAYGANLARFRRHPGEALELLAVGESPRDPSLDPAEHAALATVAGVLLGLDEVLNKN